MMRWLRLRRMRRAFRALPECDRAIFGSVRFDDLDYIETAELHGCTVESECLIGMGSILMDNVIVKKHVFLGAGSLVPEGKVLESGYLYMGRPARKVRALTPEEIKHFLWSAAHYVQLKNQYLDNK